MKDRDLIEEKLNQATAILREYDVDLWLTFARETGTMPDPILDFILGFSITWHSAFILTKSGRRIAILGRYEAENVRQLGLYDTVVSYDKGIGRHLIETLKEIDPKNIAINFSESDVAADGLSYGNYLTLAGYLKGSPYENRLISAEKIIAGLRGRKTSIEIERIKAAVAITEEMLELVETSVVPGMSQRQIADLFQKNIQERGFGYAWDKNHNPIVTCGPDAIIGHSFPGDLILRKGHTLHLDLGIKVNEYCSDIQRMWYVLDDGEDRPPDDVQRAFDVVYTALKKGEEAIRPGVPGWQVDEVARDYIIKSGYPEYMHAFGHLLGRSAHDGATILGPRWEKYEGLSNRLIEAGNVFTIELHVPVSGRGIMSLEEDVLVTDDGVDYLTQPQITLRTI